MIRFHRYVFYKFYSWAKDLGADSTPQWTALFSISILPLFNLLTLFGVLDLCIGKRFRLPLDSLLPKIIFLAVWAAFYYFLFIYHQKYEHIANEFENESDDHRRQGTIYTWVYICVTFLFFFGSLYLSNLHNLGVI